MTTLVAKLSIDKSQTRTRNRVLDLRILHKDLPSVFHDQYALVQGQTISIVCRSFVYLYSRDQISNATYSVGVGSQHIDIPNFQGFMSIPVGGTLTITQNTNNSDTMERYIEVLHD